MYLHKTVKNWITLHHFITYCKFCIQEQLRDMYSNCRKCKPRFLLIGANMYSRSITFNFETCIFTRNASWRYERTQSTSKFRKLSLYHLHISIWTRRSQFFTVSNLFFNIQKTYGKISVDCLIIRLLSMYHWSNMKIYTFRN